MASRIAEQAFLTDTGRQRAANEDSYFARGPLYAVADGMGGAQAGEVASRLAAEAFEPAERGSLSPEAFLRSIVETANRRINSVAHQDVSRSGMGTTVTAALVEGDEISLAHVGDSRAYRLRDGELRLLTTDHSLVEELRRQGRLTAEQAEQHPQRSIITRALGPEPEVEVDTMTYATRPGDIYLLCSDGLTTMLKEERVRELLDEADTLEDAATRLVDAANEAGGRDNITVVTFRIEEGEPAEAVDDATLVGPAAAAAGLSGEAIQAEAARVRRTSMGGAASQQAATAREPRRRGRTALKAFLALLLIAGIVAGSWVGTRQVYFLGTDEGGRMALYRGLPYELPLGINLYSEVLSSPARVISLPENRRDEVTDHELRSREDAIDLLDNLEAAALSVRAEETESRQARQRGTGGRDRQNSGPASGNR